MWFVYIMRCKDDKLYTGITSDLERRMAEHNSGHGGRFTRFRKPVTLAYYCNVNSRPEALKREAVIKRLRREEKLELVRSFGTN